MTTLNDADVVFGENEDSIEDELTLDDLVQQEKPFPGIITSDVREPNQFGGEQIYIAVKSRRNDGTEATFPAYLPIYKNKDGNYSTFGPLARVGGAIRKVFFPNKKGIVLGKGNLLGLAGMWVLRNYEYMDNRKELDGKANPNYKVMVTAKRPDLIVLRALTQEETDALGYGGASVSSVQVDEEATTPIWNSDDVDIFMEVMEGKTSVQFTQGLKGNKRVTQEHRRAILSGDASRFLTSNGFASQENGIITRIGELANV